VYSSGDIAGRDLAEDVVGAGVCSDVLVQLWYAIGVARQTNIYVDTYGTAKVDMADGEIAKVVDKTFDMTQYAIEKRLKLRTPMYGDCAAYGHMGRTPEKKTVKFTDGSGNEKAVKIETFTWEKLDMLPAVKKAFKIK